MGHRQMLRVSRVEDRLRRAPARPDLRTHGDCVVIRSAVNCGGRPAAGLAAGVTAESAGAKGLCLHLVMIPPGTRSMPRLHADRETAVYAVSGEAEVWHGAELVNRTLIRAGDFMYIPPGTAHVAVNRGEVTAIAVVARTGPADLEAGTVVELPRHLAGLLSTPVAVQE